jgi:phosphomannomutase
MNSSVFRPSDIRGVYPDELDEAFAFALGAAVARGLGATRLACGHDARLSSPALYAHVLAGAQAVGTEVRGLGLCPTELVYFESGRGDCDVAVMVTASHNPPAYNGFKVVGAGNEPVLVEHIAGWMKQPLPHMPDETPAVPRPEPPLEAYMAEAFAVEPAEALRGRRVAVDAGNGTAWTLWETVARRVDCELIPLNAEPDGHFPGRGPDPYEPGALEGLVETVRRNRAEIGLAFDGDADRLAVVDASGAALSGSEILALTAERFLEEHKGEGTVACNLVTSRATLEHLENLGWQRYLVPVGHGLIKQRMRADDRLLFAGEPSGHFFYRRLNCSDSAFLTSLLIIGLAGDLAKRRAALPGGWIRPARESRIRADSRDQAVEACRRAAAGYIREELGSDGWRLACEVRGAIVTGRDLSLIDDATGVRCDAETAWFCLRPSGTEPILRVSGEARSAETLEALLSGLTRRVREAR